MPTKKKKPEIKPLKVKSIVSVPIESVVPKTIIGPTFTLVRFPEGVFKDIYGRPEILATRMRWINKDVLIEMNSIETSPYKGMIVISDITRKPSESFIARQQKGKHVAQVGLSGHNYGISIDIDIKKTAHNIGVHPNQLPAIMKEMGLIGISSESWHYNFRHLASRYYFYSLYEKASKEFKAHFKKGFVSKFNKAIGLNLKSIKTIQAYLDITSDGILGRQSFCAASMLMAERLGMYNTSDPKATEIVIDFGLVWR